jgi:hypothetical protein
MEEFNQQYPTHLDDKDWLSKALLSLSSLVYETNKQLSQAGLDEARAAVSYHDQLKDGKRMTVGEADKRAIVDTNNAKGTLENTKEGITAMIHAIEARLEVLSAGRS